MDTAFAFAQLRYGGDTDKCRKQESAILTFLRLSDSSCVTVRQILWALFCHRCFGYTYRSVRDLINCKTNFDVKPHTMEVVVKPNFG